MEIVRSGQSPWGESILLGIGGDLVWIAVVAAAVVLGGHALFLWARGRRGAASAEGEAAAGPVPPAPPTASAPDAQRVPRHSLGARAFHWSMAAAMLVLLATAFVPVLGLRFPWVTVHWVAGLVLLATLVWHVVHVFGWQDWRTMVVRPAELAGGVEELKHALGVGEGDAPRSGKYAFDHKLYHHMAAAAGLAATATGLLMMVRVDTPLWTRDPYLLSDATWGWVYLVHGLSGVALIGLVAAHVYFAVRPEKRWMTWGMVRGWITREEYAAHYDPERWPVPGTDA